jgi:hypothetical protein
MLQRKLFSCVSLFSKCDGVLLAGETVRKYLEFSSIEDQITFRNYFGCLCQGSNFYFIYSGIPAVLQSERAVKTVRCHPVNRFHLALILVYLCSVSSSYCQSNRGVLDLCLAEKLEHHRAVLQWGFGRLS